MAHLEVLSSAHHLADEVLAALVGGVGLAGKHELHRPVGITQQRLQPGRITQQQRSALVGGEPSGKPQGEHIGVQGLVTPCHL